VEPSFKKKPSVNWVIWPIFSSRVMRLSNVSTAESLGATGSRAVARPMEELAAIMKAAVNARILLMLGILYSPFSYRYAAHNAGIQQST
jgi:hypothetical protein